MRHFGHNNIVFNIYWHSFQKHINIEKNITERRKSDKVF